MTTTPHIPRRFAAARAAVLAGAANARPLVAAALEEAEQRLLDADAAVAALAAARLRGDPRDDEGEEAVAHVARSSRDALVAVLAALYAAEAAVEVEVQP